jgi:putative nucleotide binding protein
MIQQRTRAKEEYVIVLEFLRHGYSEDPRPLHKKESIVQAIGKDHFILLELVPVEGVFLKPYDEVYIGDGKREQISYIKSALEPTKLTQTARTELPFVIEKLVDEKIDRFINFFNTAGAISLRSHQLELLPGIGKRHAKELLKERESQAFTDFEDIKTRVPSVPDPKKAIIQRIMLELEGADRYRLFVGV